MYKYSLQVLVLVYFTVCTHSYSLLYYIYLTIRISVLQYCVINYTPIQFFLHMYMAFTYKLLKHISKNLPNTYLYIPVSKHFIFFSVCMYKLLTLFCSGIYNWVAGFPCLWQKRRRSGHLS